MERSIANLRRSTPSLEIDPDKDSPQMSKCKAAVWQMAVASIKEAHSLVNQTIHSREGGVNSTLAQHSMRSHTEDLPTAQHPNLKTAELTKFANTVAEAYGIEDAKIASQVLDDLTPRFEADITSIAERTGVSPSVLTEYFQNMAPHITTFTQDVVPLRSNLTSDENEALSNLMDATSDAGFRELLTLMKGATNDQEPPVE